MDLVSGGAGAGWAAGAGGATTSAATDPMDEGEVIPALLPKDVVFAAILSERAAHGVALHQTASMSQLVTEHLPAIIMEQPQIVAEMASSIHVLELQHVAVEMPAARTECGFHDWVDGEGARVTRNTLSNAVVIDVRHRVFSLQARKEASKAEEEEWRRKIKRND